MPRADASRPARRAPSGLRGDGYWHVAKRPLQILAFLLPLIVAYELSLAFVLPSEDGMSVVTVEAHKQLLLVFLRAFAAFGIQPVGWLYLGGIAIVVVLLLWHIMAREKWIIDLRSLLVMAVESALLALPLLVLAFALTRPAPQAAVLGPGAATADLSLLAKLSVMVGAGLYEELVFRMILIASVHALLVDLAKASGRLGTIIALLVSAAAFTAYHDLRGPDEAISIRKLAFYLAAGLYFGFIYVTRGFGIVVGAHALYDVITVLMPASEAS